MASNYPPGAEDHPEAPYNEVETKDCDDCEGKGDGYWSCCTGELITHDIKMCPKCHEHLGEEECETCEGKGEVPLDNKEGE
tara:strand:- start:1729 stop:1971 length:243 start_codon:yes stop_codon:yes gene_type:complete